MCRFASKGMHCPTSFIGISITSRLVPQTYFYLIRNRSCIVDYQKKLIIILANLLNLAQVWLMGHEIGFQNGPCF